MRSRVVKRRKCFLGPTRHRARCTAASIPGRPGLRPMAAARGVRRVALVPHPPESRVLTPQPAGHSSSLQLLCPRLSRFRPCHRSRNQRNLAPLRCRICRNCSAAHVGTHAQIHRTGFGHARAELETGGLARVTRACSMFIVCRTNEACAFWGRRAIVVVAAAPALGAPYMMPLGRGARWPRCRPRPVRGCAACCGAGLGPALLIGHRQFVTAPRTRGWTLGSSCRAVPNFVAA